MNEAERAKELKELGHLLIETSLNFIHPQFEKYHPEWSLVCGVGEKLVAMSVRDEVAE